MPRSLPVLAWLVHFAIALALWFAYVGKFAAGEALFGAICAAVTALASKLVFEERIAPLRAQWRSVAQAFRLPWNIVTDTVTVLAVLARQLFLRVPAGSLFLTVPFDTGGDDEESAIRRALAVAYTSATPNSVVIGIDRERRLLVYHQLQRTEVSEMTKRLGARP